MDCACGDGDRCSDGLVPRTAQIVFRNNTDVHNYYHHNDQLTWVISDSYGHLKPRGILPKALHYHPPKWSQATWYITSYTTTNEIDRIITDTLEIHI